MFEPLYACWLIQWTARFTAGSTPGIFGVTATSTDDPSQSQTVAVVVLGGAGLPSVALDRMGLTVFDTVLPIVVEAAILLAFGVAMLAIAVRNFRIRD